MSKRRKKRSNKGITNYWYEQYVGALELLGVQVKRPKNVTKASLGSVRKKFQKEQAKLDKEKRIGVRQAYEQNLYKKKQQAQWQDTPRDNQYRTAPAPNTIDFATQTINDFLSLADKVYRNTVDYMDRVRDKSNHEEGKLGNIADYGLVTSSYDNLRKWVSDTIEVVGKEALANIIASDSFIDYEMAITLVPPSDVLYNFEMTIDNLQSALQYAIDKAEQQAEQEGR